MTVAQMLTSLSSVLTLAFAVSSMFSMGLRLSPSEVLEPLRNVRLVIMALLANFVIVPVTAIVLARFLLAQQDLETGLVLAGAVAGAPMVIKLAQIAKGSARLAVGLVVLLVVATVIYLPIALPLLLPGVTVNALHIAILLFLELLLPLCLGFLVAARYEDESESLQPVMDQIANISLALMLVLTLGLNIDEVLGLFGSGGIIALLLLIAIALAAGYLLGGPDVGTRRMLALGTGQRNLAAAFVVATGNFADRPDVLVMLAAVGLVAMIVVLPIAGEFGKRGPAAAKSAAESGKGSTTGRDQTGRF